MTKIEWTEATWNPIVGCSIISPGCTNCYAMRMAARLEAMAVAHYAGTTQRVNSNPAWTGTVAMAPEKIFLEPLRRRKPTSYFVNSMGDLFHEDVPDEWIDQVFAVMALSLQHTFQVLTKRSARMLSYMDAISCIDGRQPDLRAAISVVTNETGADRSTATLNATVALSGARETGCWKPLPNVWLGVSAERQQEADARIPDLLATPAAVRFVSAEPLLGPIDFTKISELRGDRRDVLEGTYWLEGHAGESGRTIPGMHIDWVIVGGESGPGARPMRHQWAADIVRQCQEAGVACFVKQLGAAYEDARDGVAGTSIKVSSEADQLVTRRLRHFKGADMTEWPIELQVRETPQPRIAS